MTPTPMFPLGTVLLPGQRLPLQVFEPRYLALLDACLNHADEPEFGIVLIARGHEVGGGDMRTDVGTIARIVGGGRIDERRYGVVVAGTERFKVERWLDDDPYPRAEIAPWPDEPGEPGAAIVARVGAGVARLHELLDVEPAELPADSFALAAALPLPSSDSQRVLAAPGPAERMSVIAEALDDVVAALRFRLGG